MNKNYDDLGMYLGNNCIFNGMRTYAKIVFPSEISWDSCSDKVSNILLNVMGGYPNSPGRALRVFNKFVACDTLAKHLMHKNVTIEEAIKLRDNDLHIYNTCGRKALPSHIDD